MASPYTAWPIIVKSYSYIIEQFFPEECLNCGQEGAWLCGDCLNKAIAIKTPTCPFCSCISKNGRTCTKCQPKHTLTGARSVWYYQTTMTSLVQAFKYKKIHASQTFMAPYLVELYASLPLRPKHRVIITAVPATKDRLLERGFNQSEVLAKAVARAVNAPYLPLLERQQHAPSQTTLSRKQRLALAAMQFKLAAKTPDIAGYSIVIVDDVITTGATLSFCARQLKAAGARQVWGLTVAKD